MTFEVHTTNIDAYYQEWLSLWEEIRQQEEENKPTKERENGRLTK